MDEEGSRVGGGKGEDERGGGRSRGRVRGRQQGRAGGRGRPDRAGLGRQCWAGVPLAGRPGARRGGGLGGGGGREAAAVPAGGEVRAGRGDVRQRGARFVLSLALPRRPALLCFFPREQLALGTPPPAPSPPTRTLNVRRGGGSAQPAAGRGRAATGGGGEEQPQVAAAGQRRREGRRRCAFRGMAYGFPLASGVCDLVNGRGLCPRAYAKMVSMKERVE